MYVSLKFNTDIPKTMADNSINSGNERDSKVPIRRCKLVAVEHLTLDGVYQGPGRPDEDMRDGFKYGGWAVAGMDPRMQEVISKHMSSGWSLLAGRTTYEQFYAHWPKQPEPNPMGKALTNVQKFVASYNPDIGLPWQNSTLLAGDINDSVARLKKEHDKTLVIFGSGVLLRALMKAGLIEELLLMIHPLVLGKGRHLFTEENPFTKLRLTDSETTGTGVIIATYKNEPKQPKTGRIW